jgi:hypothetical protein
VHWALEGPSAMLRERKPLGNQRIMNANKSGQFIINSTEFIISEINELIHRILDKVWMSDGWQKVESGASHADVHPLINLAYSSYQQINQFMKDDKPGITPEIYELTELAIKINALKKNNVLGLQTRLTRLM